MKIYIVMENYENAYSHPVMATDDKEQALMVMKYRKNPEADTIWIEETTFYKHDNS